MQLADGGHPLLYIFLRMVEGGILLTMTILWLRAMHRAMSACSPPSRAGEPGQVWLTLIPVFGLVWQFIALNRTSESLAREYHRRGWNSDEGRPAFELGTITCVTVCIVAVVRGIWAIHPGLGFLGTLGIGFSMYRHIDRLNAYSERLEKEPNTAMPFGQNPVMPPPQWNTPQPPFPPPPNFQYPPPPAFGAQFPPPQWNPQQPPFPADPNYPPPPAQWNTPPPPFPADTNYPPPPAYTNYPPPPQHTPPQYIPPPEPWMPPLHPGWQAPPPPATPPPPAPPQQQEEDPMKRWMPKDDQKN